MSWAGNVTPGLVIAGSAEYVSIPISASTSPITTAVAMAFIPAYGTLPQTGDWVAGAWNLQQFEGKWIARTLVGPGGAVLAAGSYTTWVRVGLAVTQAGRLVIQ